MSFARTESAGTAPTLAALVTPPGRAALATLAVRGPEARRSVSALCATRRVPQDATLPVGRPVLRHWHRPDGEPVVVYAANATEVDITCHGGPVPVQTILEDLSAAGVRTVAWRELLRAEPRSMIQAEAVEALAEAPTLRTAAILLDQYHGALAECIRQLRQRLQQAREPQRVEAAAADVGDELSRLLAQSTVGLHLVQPWRIAIVGRPNVGKSSLLNALVGFARAIVHPTAGTTRDVVTAVTAVGGWPAELCDSAGIRSADDALESAGVQRARAAIEQSDWQLVVLDRSQPITDGDQAILRSCPRPIVVANKTDLPAASPAAAAFTGSHAVSALTGAGIAPLVDQIAARLVADPPAPGVAVPFTTRQIQLLREAEACVKASDCAAAERMIDQLLA